VFALQDRTESAARPMRMWSSRAHLIAAVVLASGFVAALAINLPGHLEYDSFQQLIEGRRGVYDYWHPPIMSWILGVEDAIVRGASLFVIFNTILAFGSLALLLWLPRRVSWAAVMCAAIFVALPQLILYQGIVWKDILFADTCVAAFVCLAYTPILWPQPGRRFALMAASVVLLSIAALTRQNGAIILPCAAAALGLIAARQSPAHRWRAGLVYASAFLFFTGALCSGASALLQLRSDGRPSRQQQIKLLEEYDLVGALKRQPDLPLSELTKSSPELVALMRKNGVRLYSPIAVDPLDDDDDLHDALDNAPADTLAQQWRQLIVGNPGIYIAVRERVFGWLFLGLHTAQCVPYVVGVEDDEPEMRNELGIKPRFDNRDKTLENYVKKFVGTPVMAHVTFGALAFLSFVLLIVRRRTEDIAVAGLLAAAMLYTLSFFVISIACCYRYLYLLDLSAMAAMLYLSCDFKLPSSGKSASKPGTRIT